MDTYIVKIKAKYFKRLIKYNINIKKIKRQEDYYLLYLDRLEYEKILQFKKIYEIEFIDYKGLVKYKNIFKNNIIFFIMFIFGIFYIVFFV